MLNENIRQLPLRYEILRFKIYHTNWSSTR